MPPPKEKLPPPPHPLPLPHPSVGIPLSALWMPSHPVLPQPAPFLNEPPPCFPFNDISAQSFAHCAGLQLFSNSANLDPTFPQNYVAPTPVLFQPYFDPNFIATLPPTQTQSHVYGSLVQLSTEPPTPPSTPTMATNTQPSQSVHHELSDAIESPPPSPLPLPTQLMHQESESEPSSPSSRSSRYSSFYSSFDENPTHPTLQEESIIFPESPTQPSISAASSSFTGSQPSTITIQPELCSGEELPPITSEQPIEQLAPHTNTLHPNLKRPRGKKAGLPTPLNLNKRKWKKKDNSPHVTKDNEDKSSIHFASQHADTKPIGQPKMVQTTTIAPKPELVTPSAPSTRAQHLRQKNKHHAKPLSVTLKEKVSDRESEPLSVPAAIPAMLLSGAPMPIPLPKNAHQNPIEKFQGFYSKLPNVPKLNEIVSLTKKVAAYAIKKYIPWKEPIIWAHIINTAFSYFAKQWQGYTSKVLFSIFNIASNSDELHETNDEDEIDPWEDLLVQTFLKHDGSKSLLHPTCKILIFYTTMPDAIALKYIKGILPSLKTQHFSWFGIEERSTWSKDKAISFLQELQDFFEEMIDEQTLSEAKLENLYSEHTQDRPLLSYDSAVKSAEHSQAMRLIIESLGQVDMSYFGIGDDTETINAKAENIYTACNSNAGGMVLLIDVSHHQIATELKTNGFTIFEYVLADRELLSIDPNTKSPNIFYGCPSCHDYYVTHNISALKIGERSEIKESIETP